MQLFRQRTEWGVLLSGFGRPFGIGFNRESNLFVTDMDCHVVVQFEIDFETFRYHPGGEGWSAPIPVLPGYTAERPTRSPHGWNGPHSVAADRFGQLIVTCYYGPAIAVVGPDGKARTLIGGGHLTGPATAQLDAEENLLVAEYSQNLILAFDPDGKYLGRLGRSLSGDFLGFSTSVGCAPPSADLGGFDRPHMAKALSDRSIVVADTWNDRLQRFSPAGEFLAWHGGSGWSHITPNGKVQNRSQFKCPVALDEDASGRLLVTAWGSNKILLFGPGGDLLPIHGVPELNRPYDARFFRTGAVVADTHNGRILILDKINCNDH